jgi:hypothetical protein
MRRADSLVRANTLPSDRADKAVRAPAGALLDTRTKARPDSIPLRESARVGGVQLFFWHT